MILRYKHIMLKNDGLYISDPFHGFYFSSIFHEGLRKICWTGEDLTKTIPWK
jgi:hypothetical protein